MDIVFVLKAFVYFLFDLIQFSCICCILFVFIYLCFFLAISIKISVMHAIVNSGSLKKMLHTLQGLEKNMLHT